MDTSDKSEDLKSYILPNLEMLSFAYLDFMPSPEEENFDGEPTGTLWLARPLSPEEDKPEFEIDDPDFEYQSVQSAQSDRGIDPDTFLQDLVEFCKKRKNLRVITFSEIDEDVPVAKCRELLRPLEIEVRA
jgi:hypothetical protein